VPLEIVVVKKISIAIPRRFWRRQFRESALLTWFYIDQRFVEAKKNLSRKVKPNFFETSRHFLSPFTLFSQNFSLFVETPFFKVKVHKELLKPGANNKGIAMPCV